MMSTDEVRSATWDERAEPRISIHVSSYSRSAFLADLVAALEAQDLADEDYEVVIVDNASTDDTWDVLGDLVRHSGLRMLGLRIERNTGPAAARNLAVSRTAGPILAFTDDDCIPSTGWLQGLLDAMGQGVSVVQGRVAPPNADWSSAGPWDHTKWVSRMTPFFETCNVAYRRREFESAGGFDQVDSLLSSEGGSAFGEDAVLAWTVLQHGGGSAFAEDALVHHRCVPWSFTRHIRAQRNVVGFPGLARRSPIFGRWLKAGVFLSKRSAAFDAAMVSVLAAVVVRNPLLLAGVLPWLWFAAKHAVWRTRGDKYTAMTVLPGVAVTDLVTFVSLFEGSIRHRRLVL